MIMRTFKDSEFKMNNHEKELKTMVRNTEQALDDLNARLAALGLPI